MKKDLKTGWLSFVKEKEGDGFKLLFDAALTLNLDAETTWRQMALAFTDTAKSWAWPVQYSTSAPVTPPLAEGGMIRTTYNMPRRKDPALPWYSFTYGYKMIQWKPEARQFEYRTADDHPMNGGARVHIDDLGAGKSRLNWHGVYHLTREQEIIGDSFGWFFPIFIQALEERLTGATKPAASRSLPPAGE